MIRIETAERRDLVTLALSGRIQAEDLPELRRVMESYNRPVVLYLPGVRLVDRDAVRFLAYLETGNTTITNCPPYVHEWILRERVQP